MKRIAFVFTTAPHGVASGREGLDALLAASAFTDDIGVFLSAMVSSSCLRASGQRLFWRVITSPPLKFFPCTTLKIAGCARPPCANAA